MAALAGKYKDEGAGILKVKLGKNIEDDIEAVRKIRNKVGSKISIRVDANQGWSFDEAVRTLQALEEEDIEFCEQPMRTWNDDDLPELRKLSPVKIMADESCSNHYDARKLIKNRACDYINIKFAKSGGILEALKIHQISADAGVACMIGAMLESRIGLSAKLHFAYACTNIKFFDLDSCLLGHLEDPCAGGLSYKNYFLDIADTPGIGADADEGFLEKCEKWTV
jgi:L-alanine-DL-glutamate epimerase-like enolase superfamily enzyme